MGINMKKLNSITQISWKRILIFFIIATAISNIFRFDIFALKPALKQLPTWIYLFSTGFLEGSGVLIAALTAIWLLRKHRKSEISLFGTSTSKSLIMILIPIIILSVIGVKNEFDLSSHLYGFIAIIATLLYCIMEEYGWRGYLQEELKFLKPWQKYLLIGSIWYLWHLSFLTKASFADNLFFWAMMIFGSWGIGMVAEATKSILASACFHLIIQIMMFNSLIKNGISGNEKLLILGICVVIWYVIVKKWEKDTAATASTSADNTV